MRSITLKWIISHQLHSLFDSFATSPWSRQWRDIKQLNWKSNLKLFAEKIRVGKDYQVVVPEMSQQRQDNYPDKALLVWSPANEIVERKLEEYITLAKESFGYNAEQALGMLFWHKHDLAKAVIDLSNFTPFPDEWTKEDKVLFEQAFQFHGKCFHRIRQMVRSLRFLMLRKL